jgi:hypothetical protein
VYFSKRNRSAMHARRQHVFAMLRGEHDGLLPSPGSSLSREIRALQSE